MSTPDFIFKRISSGEPHLMAGMLDVFAAAFDDVPSYAGQRPGHDYTRRLLESESFVGLVALHDGRVIGGLAAYELVKFEQERSEFYIYDLAVDEDHRRTCVATGLILALKPIAAARGAKVIFIQADRGDHAATALYTRLGRAEDVLHFDIATDQ